MWADTVTTGADHAEAERLMALADAVRAAIATHRPVSVAGNGWRSTGTR